MEQKKIQLLASHLMPKRHLLEFNRTFIKWIKTLYKNLKEIVITNGVILPLFKPTRDTPHGCGLSPLAIATRENANIRWVEEGGKEHKLFCIWIF